MANASRIDSLRTARGASLIEVMVMIGLASIMLIGISSGLTLAFKSSRTAEANQAVTSLGYQIKNWLNNPSSCNGVFKDLDSDNGAAVPLPLEITESEAYFILVHNLPVSAVLTNITDLGGSARRAEVVVSGTKAGSSFTPDFSRSFSVYYTVDGANKIVSCLTTTPPNVYCTSLGGTWDVATSKCDFCTMMGGTKVAGSCVLGP